MAPTSAGSLPLRLCGGRAILSALGDYRAHLFGERTDLTLRVHYGPASSEARALRPAYRPLGSILPATGKLPIAPARGGPRLHLPIKCLGGEQYAHQWWCVDTELTDASTEANNGLTLSWAQTDEFMFALVSVDARMPLEQQSIRAYRVLLQTLRTRKKPHLLRIWNYVPRISELENGTERYQLFNSGRKQVYQELGYTVAEGAPAACALGTQSGGLQIAILAGNRASVAIENPRQVSSYNYPEQYGAQPPIFSRAAWLQQLSGENLLFISGTASIVGHQTLHPGDILAQTEEAVRNIQAVLDNANQKAGATIWTLSGLTGRVYIRKAADYPLVSGYLLAQGMTEFCYVQADICRSELLLEIEAEGQYTASPPRS